MTHFCLSSIGGFVVIAGLFSLASAMSGSLLFGWKEYLNTCLVVMIGSMLLTVGAWMMGLGAGYDIVKIIWGYLP